MVRTVVEVRHKPEHTRFWYFVVPEKLCDSVEVGSTVLCETRKGRKDGIVMSVKEIEFTEDEISRLTNGHIIRPIIAVETNFKTNDVIIPDRFLSTNPRDSKVQKQIDSISRDGVFSTNVIIKADNVLVDGYSALIAAKMLGMRTIRGFMV